EGCEVVARELAQRVRGADADCRPAQAGDLAGELRLVPAELLGQRRSPGHEVGRIIPVELGQQLVVDLVCGGQCLPMISAGAPSPAVGCGTNRPDARARSAKEGQMEPRKVIVTVAPTGGI